VRRYELGGQPFGVALSRDGLEGIFEKLGEEFDFIVVDSHPVLAATDSAYANQRTAACECVWSHVLNLHR